MEKKSKLNLSKKQSQGMQFLQGNAFFKSLNKVVKHQKKSIDALLII